MVGLALPGMRRVYERVVLTSMREGPDEQPIFAICEQQACLAIGPWKVLRPYGDF